MKAMKAARERKPKARVALSKLMRATASPVTMAELAAGLAVGARPYTLTDLAAAGAPDVRVDRYWRVG